MQRTYIPKPLSYSRIHLSYTHTISYMPFSYIYVLIDIFICIYIYPYIIVASCNPFNSHNYSTHICSITIHTQSFIHTFHLHILIPHFMTYSHTIINHFTQHTIYILLLLFFLVMHTYHFLS